MDGRLLCGLRRYVVEEYGEETWDAVLAEAPVEPQLFVPVTEYPDRDFYGLLEATAGVTGQDAAAIERAFGRRLLPILLEESPEERQPLALLESVESWVRPAFADEDCVDASDLLAADRLDDHRVALRYGCPRGLCRVLAGLVHAVAAAHDADLRVRETTCMHDGDESCRFTVTAGPTAAPVHARRAPGTPPATD